MFRNIYKAFLFTILSIAICAGTKGKIAGYVTDAQTGEPLISANVYIQELGTGSTTDEDGYYFIINLPPGRYDVTVSYVGYSKLTKTNVLVQVDRTTDLNFELQPVSLQSEEIVVEAEQEAVERDLTSTKQNVDESQIETLPVNTLEDIIELQSGVVNDTGALHVRGGRAGEVAYYIDGYRVQDPLFNGQVIEVNNQAIQQMEFLSGTFNAEYGNALSGVINIVTKENFEKLNFNFTHKRTNVGLEDASDNYNDRYYEGYLSGPLWEGSPIGVLFSAKKSDRDNYYFSGISRTVQDSTGKNVIESIEFSKDKPFGYNDYLTMLGKIYFSPFQSGKITLLYNYSDRQWQSYDHVLRFIPDSSYIRNSGSHLFGLNFTHALSEKLFYEMRLSYYKYNYLRQIGDMHYTEYPIPLFLRFNNSRFYRSLADNAYEDQTTKTYTFKGDLTYQIDRYNLVKAGIDLKLHDFDYFYISQPNNPNARFEVNYDQQPFEGAVYIQDKIEFETIILNLGLRYDFYNPEASYVADPFDKDQLADSEIQTALSPRAGIAYPILENLVFHFAYGQFFQRPEYQILYENLQREFGTGEPLFGNPNLKPEKTSSYELGLLASLGNQASIQTTFFSKKIEDLIGVSWTYQPIPYASYVNEDFATVRGFEISGEWGNQNIFASANYTFSIAEGSSSSQQERYSGAFDIVGTQSLKYLPLDFDQRHTANAQLTFRFGENDGPWGLLPSVFENFKINLVARYGSGLPYTYNPARARYVPEQNNARLEETIFVDLLVRKEFYIGDYYISVFADVRNLLDRDNIRSVYSATGSPDFSGALLRGETPDYMQDPTNYYPPRTIYLGVNLGF